MRSRREVGLDRHPVVAVGGVDRDGPQAQAVRSVDLVPHEAEERADDERWAVPLVPPQPGGDPVHEALAPPGPLHHERPGAVPHDRLDGLALALAEGRGGAEHGLDVGLEGIGRDGHGPSMGLPPEPPPGPLPGRNQVAARDATQACPRSLAESPPAARRDDWPALAR